MKTYLHDTLFSYYTAGIYMGTLRYAEEQILFAKVDERRRTQMQENRWESQAGFVLPLEKIRERLPVYAGTDWQGEVIELDSGERYERHIRCAGEIAGHPDCEAVAQVWAGRLDTALDIVTLDGAVIAFICPNRYGMEVLVKKGYEKLTPLALYDDPLLSQPLYGVNDLGAYLVPMSDGVRLATDVYLPEGIAAGTRLPAILVRTCYDRVGREASFKRWAHKGYAVVAQDVRGRADSEGELVPFYYERDDSSDTIDWIIDQDWSDGQVGMWGASYLGYVAVAAATSGHPHLKAVVDEVNVGSPFVDTVRRGGTVCSWPLLCWTLAQSKGTRTDFDVFAGVSVDPEAAVDARPIKEIPQQMIGHASKPWDLWSEHPEYDEFWRNCTFTERGDRVKAPMFVISGWYDGDSAGVSETWRMLSEHDVPDRRIRLGPWEHGPNRARDYGGVAFGNDAVVYDYDIAILRFFDRYLRGVDNGFEREPRAEYYVVGENAWRTSANWPPEEAKTVCFYLDSGGHANSSLGDGRLVPVPAQESAADNYVYNPDEPFVVPGEREPENMRKHELRHDILVYSGEPLVAPLTVAGELSADIYAASTGRDTDWVATLCDVDESGNSRRLSSYIIRARYRHGLERPEPLVPGQVEKYTIFLPKIAYTFAAGHRVRFTLTSSDKMVAFPNPNTGGNPYDEEPPIIVTQTLHHDTRYPSHIKLPVLE